MQIRERISLTTENIPQTREEISLTSEIIPQVREKTSLTSEIIPQICEEVSLTSEIILQVSEKVSLTSGNILQIREEVSLTTENIPQIREKIFLTRENIAQIGEQVSLTSENFPEIRERARGYPERFPKRAKTAENTGNCLENRVCDQNGAFSRSMNQPWQNSRSQNCNEWVCLACGAPLRHPRRVDILLLLPGTILLIFCGLVGLKAAHRRLKPRRVLIVILIAVAISCVIWLVLNHVSQPPSPDEGLGS